MSQLSIDDKLARIGRTKHVWIKYQLAETTMQLLEDRLNETQTHRMRNVLIVADTNAGKTRLILRFLRQHRPSLRLSEPSVTYSYGRDTSQIAAPGPTSIVESLTPTTSRTTNVAYYPLGDPRQDLPRTIQVPSVAIPGQPATTTLTYSPQSLLTQSSLTGYVGSQVVTKTSTSTFDARGRLLSAKTPRTDVNETSTFAYFSDSDPDLARAGQLSQAIDALGHVTNIGGTSGSSYDPYGQAEASTDANGVSSTKTFDLNGHLTASSVQGIVDGSPATVLASIAYDAAQRPIEVRKPLGNAMLFGYDSADHHTTTTTLDAAGNQYDQVQNTFNSSGELVQTGAAGCSSPSPACSSWQVTTSKGFKYDTFGEPVQINDAAVTSPLLSTASSQENVTYTNQRLPATFQDENHPDAANYTFSYDLAGRQVSTVRENGPAGGFTAFTPPPSTGLSFYATTSMAYDTSDDVTSFTDPNGNVTSMTYDDFGNLTSRTSPDTGHSSFSYDADDNLVQATDADGAVTTNTYDALDRRISSVSTKPNTATETVSWSYDDPTLGNFGIGRLKSMTDPTGTTSYTYDFRGNTASVTRRLASGTFAQAYSYDANNNMDGMTYPDGTRIVYGYDYADRPYSVTDVARGPYSTDSKVRTTSTQRRPVQTIREGTHPLGRLAGASATHPNAPVTTTRSRPITSDEQLPPVPSVLHPLEHSFYAAALERPLAAFRPTRSALNRRRSDSLSVAGGTPIVSATYYAPFGPLIGRQYFNGTVETRYLDARYRPSRTTLISPVGVSLSDISYTEDGDGNVINETDALNSMYNKAYVYDDMDRLVAAVTGVPTTSGLGNTTSNLSNPSAPLWGAAAYTYDAMGNMTNEVVGTRTQAFSYNGTTSLIKTVRGTGSNQGTVTYDADGNETAIGQNSYGYSARNELVQAQGPIYGDYSIPSSTGLPSSVTSQKLGNPWTYAYDGFGERLSTTTNKSALLSGVSTLSPSVLSSSSSQRYSIPDIEGHLSTESSTTSPGTTAYDYVWMGGAPVAQIDAEGYGVHYTFTNHLGAPIIQTDPSGNVSYQADYEPFGSVYALRGSSNPHQPLRLPGQTAEQFEDGANGATDLSYNNARWYRPQWGRYNQSDPIGLRGGYLGYGYAGDNPINGTDRLGLCTVVASYHWITDLWGTLLWADHGLVQLWADQPLSPNYIYEAEPSGSRSFDAPFQYDLGGRVDSTDPANYDDRIGPVNRTPDRIATNIILNKYKDVPCECFLKRLDEYTRKFNAKNYKYKPWPDRSDADAGYANSNTYFYGLLQILEGTDNPSIPASDDGSRGPTLLPGYFNAS